MELYARVSENRPGKFPINILNKVLQRVSYQWNSRTVINKRAIQELADFYNLKMGYTDNPIDYKTALCLARVSARINAELWNILNPRSEQEILRFHKVSPWYPFELGYWHMLNYQKSNRKLVMDHCFGHVLDYGGGIGDLSLSLARKGLKVTYADIEGTNFDFARWLFARYNQNIRMLNVSENSNLPEKYNVIVCLDVIGHVPRPEELLHQFFDHLEDHGRLIITQLKPPDSKEYNPMHLRLGLNIERVFNELHLTRINDAPREVAILEKRAPPLSG